MGDYTAGEMELWGTIQGWSTKLGLPLDVLRERFKGLPSQKCIAADPYNSKLQIVTDSYPQSAVMAVLADLLTGQPGEDRSKHDSM